MRIPPPPDRALRSSAAALLDGEAVAARLGATTCRPRYARYKPETSLLVQYEAMIGSTITLLHAWSFADARAVRTWRSGSFERLIERAYRRHPHLPVQAVFLNDLNVLVEVSPLDSRLPALVRAASARKVARFLGDRVPASLARSSVETLRHKPGRKALLRFVMPCEQVYLKVYADSASSRRFALARAVAACGVPTATAVADIAQLGAVAYAEAPGERLADIARSEQYRLWLRPAAEALWTFHSRAPLHGRASPKRYPVAAAGRAIDSLLPTLRGGGARLAAQIEKRLTVYDATPVLTHGDFYDDQILVAPEQVIILDLDEARPGHPLVDVGNFLAHLSVRSDESGRAAFLEACADVGFDLTGVVAFEAAALLALAVRPFRNLEPTWPERVEELIELAAVRLRADRALRGTSDRTLPQLHSLLDPVAARPVLARTLGRPVGIAAVHVLRHKPGRRCTLRYQLDDGASVFAKTYASRRAARVHENYRRLAAGNGVRLPVPLGWDDDSRLVATTPLPGNPLHDRLHAGDRRLGNEIAELLHAFHSSGVVLERRHTLDDEISPLADRVARLTAAAPALGASAQHCLFFATTGRDRDWLWRSRPVHRDFYDDQLLADRTGLAILDLDDAAMSEPAVDVANLIAHLRLPTVLGEPKPGRLNAVARAFLRRYHALDPALDPRLVVFLVGTTLLRLAEIHLTRGGAQAASALLARSERALQFGLAPVA